MFISGSFFHKLFRHEESRIRPALADFDADLAQAAGASADVGTAVTVTIDPYIDAATFKQYADVTT